MVAGVPVAGRKHRRESGVSAVWGGLLWKLSQALGLHRARHAVQKGSGARVPLSPTPTLLYKRITCKHRLILPSHADPSTEMGPSFC